MRYYVPCLFLYSCLGLLFFSCQSQVEEKSPRPNIIFIMSDDHAYQAISAYDDRLIETANIDRIAKMGMFLPMQV
jgi:glycosylphosphatidylinositol transamidase (GPIT) subunit GPI8